MQNLILPSNIEIKENESLAAHSTFCIGGNCDYAAFPKTYAELAQIISEIKKQNAEYVIIGNGSNVLFDDNGFSGVVIFMSALNSTEYQEAPDGVYITVDCGKMLTPLANEAGKKGLSGLEFAYGIPGSVGGAVYMNAGAYGGQISDVLVSSTYFDTDTEQIVTINANEHHYSYRHSVYTENKNRIILSTTLKLVRGNITEIHDKMIGYMNSRREKQPLSYPSAGSVFKRPGNGFFAGKLIEDSGLKGCRIGGAEVSALHAGFIVNRGGATSSDVTALISHIKETVFKNYGIMLECEIIEIGNRKMKG